MNTDKLENHPNIFTGYNKLQSHTHQNISYHEDYIKSHIYERNTSNKILKLYIIVAIIAAIILALSSCAKSEKNLKQSYYDYKVKITYFNGDIEHVTFYNKLEVGFDYRNAGNLISKQYDFSYEIERSNVRKFEILSKDLVNQKHSIQVKPDIIILLPEECEAITPNDTLSAKLNITKDTLFIEFNNKKNRP